MSSLDWDLTFTWRLPDVHLTSALSLAIFLYFLLWKCTFHRKRKCSSPGMLLSTVMRSGTPNIQRNHTLEAASFNSCYVFEQYRFVSSQTILPLLTIEHEILWLTSKLKREALKKKIREIFHHCGERVKNKRCMVFKVKIHFRTYWVIF